VYSAYTLADAKIARTDILRVALLASFTMSEVLTMDSRAGRPPLAGDSEFHCSAPDSIAPSVSRVLYYKLENA
jgi:hypothetical protein